MPLQRYLLVEGVLGADGLGVPVTNPHLPPLQSRASARFVGFRPLPQPHPDPIALIEQYEPCQEVILDHHDLRRAAAHGDLRIVGQVSARSHAEAVQKLQPPPASKSHGHSHEKKGGDK